MFCACMFDIYYTLDTFEIIHSFNLILHFYNFIINFYKVLFYVLF